MDDKRNASLGSAVGDSSAQSRVTWRYTKNIGAPWRGTLLTPYEYLPFIMLQDNPKTLCRVADTLRSNGDTRIL